MHEKNPKGDKRVALRLRDYPLYPHIALQYGDNIECLSPRSLFFPMNNAGRRVLLRCFVSEKVQPVAY
jgi:hypothetical protein